MKIQTLNRQTIKKSQTNAEERNLLLSIIEDFEDLFDGTLGDWATDPVDLDIKPYYKPFNSRYYPVPRINKKMFQKDLNILVEIGVLTPVQQSQYGTPVFIIPMKEGAVRFIMDYSSLNKKLVKKATSFTYNRREYAETGRFLVCDIVIY